MKCGFPSVSMKTSSRTLLFTLMLIVISYFNSVFRLLSMRVFISQVKKIGGSLNGHSLLSFGSGSRLAGDDTNGNSWFGQTAAVT